ncbi:MAG: DUF1800 domain-containing protein [Saprospiraceae bacterium]|nr:DUF1800 domain-containing protein [Saprospiraceae bacterium]
MKFLNRSWIILCFLLFLLKNYAQPIILGAGKNPEVKIQSSSDWNPPLWSQSATSQNVFDGSGLNFDLYNASRFLYQATLGADLMEVKRTANMGFEAWIDEQFAMKPELLSDQLEKVLEEVVDWHYVNGGDSMDEPDYFYALYFNYAWWQHNLTSKDKLRQRIALALSEIFVISANSDIGGVARGMSSYYDILVRHSFGNFKDLLLEVSLHPMMGVYLSHLNNPKTNLIENIRPDENYAREIMQLFTIGLYELNQDGSRKKDSLGRDIPTYTQRDIQELAKVFTGLSFSEIMPNQWIDTAQFGVSLYLGIPTKPMRMFDRWHEQGPKHILAGVTIPAGQTGMKDIQDAIEVLFKHPNTAPFICRQLIQRLIKSNPSNEYVARITKVFEKDENNQRGNMASVIKAILLDEEARTCEWLQSSSNGQLREPLLRYTHALNAVGVEQYYGRLWNSSYEFLDQTNQMVLNAPSVFNFFLPSFSPKGILSQMGLQGPEFQIHNSKTSIGFMNQVNNWMYDYAMYSWLEDDPATLLTFSEFEDLARDPETLLNLYDILLSHGRLSDRTREIIKTSLHQLKRGNFRNDRAKLGLYLMMISPDYAILK